MEPTGKRGPGRVAAGGAAWTLILIAGGCTLVPTGRGEFRDPEDPPDPITAEEVARRVIDPGDLRRHVAFLASDDLRGRDTPSPGLERAAAWLAHELQLAGLEPAGQDGGYIQYWPVTGDTARAPNVVAVLPGSDLTRAADPVLLLAHLDHLGVGEPGEDGDSIYNGADDNATGVAALVELAAAFVALPERPPRPVAFLAVSGGEREAAGSRWWVEHPTLDLSGLVAVLNLDMLGGGPRDTVAVLNRDAPELAARLAERAAATPSLRLTVARGESGPPLPPAPDHAAIAAAGLPVVTVSTGVHARHHRPDDEAGRVDVEKVARVARLVFLTAHDLANLPLAP